MNIRKYMQAYESGIREQMRIEGNRPHWNDLKEKHMNMIQQMQHERLIHLLVTLAFGMFLLIALAAAMIKPAPQVIILTGLFFILLVPYIMHYYFLENTLQRWYQLMDKIENFLARST